MMPSLVDEFINKSTTPEDNFYFIPRLAKSLPKGMVGRIVPSAFSGPDPRFLLDTGASRSLLSHQLASDLDLDLRAKPKPFSTAGGQFEFIESSFLMFLGGDLVELPCLVPPPSNINTQRKAINALGWKGFIGPYSMELFQHKALIYKVDDYRPAQPATWMKVKMQLESA